MRSNWIAAHPGSARNQLQAQSLFLRQRREDTANPGKRVGYRKFADCRHKRAGIELGDIEERVEQLIHPRDRVIDAIDELAAVRRCRVIAQLRDEQAKCMHRLAQVVARRGEKTRLVMACFLKLPTFFLDFIEQASVLNRDDSLVGELFDQIDLPLAELPHLLAVHHNNADQLVIPEHRHRNHGSTASNLDGGDADRITFGICPFCTKVEDVDDLFGLRRAGESGSRAGTNNLFGPKLLSKGGRQLNQRDGPKPVALALEQTAELSLT